jgi:hypothetical protein
MIQGAPTPEGRSTRNAAKQARLDAIAKSREFPRVRVVPANQDMRRILRHPTAGAFRSAGAAEWPMDTYTHRRLEDGSITLAEDEEEKKHEPRARHHAATQP